jgi:signal transduction histidine kinase
MELAAAGAGRRSRHLDRRIAIDAASAALTLASMGAAAAITASAGATQLEVLTRALIVGLPMAVGLRAFTRHDNARFGLLLAGVGAALLVATLAESNQDLPYSIGRLTGWMVEVLLIYLLLSFPTGRLPEDADRALVRAAALVVLTLYVPRLLLAAHFDVPSPYTSCTQDCPANAFFLLEHQPAFVGELMRPAGALAMVGVTAAVLLRMRTRIRTATPLARRMFFPVLAVGMARMGLLGLGLLVRQADPDAPVVQVISWGLALSAPAIALAFLVAVLSWQLDAGRALERLADWVREVPDAVTLRRALAEAFGDPSLRVALPAAESTIGWVDPSKGPVTFPEPGSGLSVSEVRDHGAVVAAVIHDDALRASPRLLDAGLAMAGVVLANQRLAAEAQTATREVQRSRTRLAASAERERRRIERDLHDGAQQRLVALRIELELAAEVVRQDPSAGIGRLHELEHEVDEALEELRSLAHGVYPPLLADRGLEEALRRVAERSAKAVDVDARDVGRYAPEVESAVYFCVLEALQNVLKHAADARRVVLRLDGSGRSELRFSVRDDGAGTAHGEITPGAGITNMSDRLAAVGGEVSITSLRTVGTTVRGRVPVGGLPAA